MHHPFMGPTSLFPNGFQVKHVAQTFYDRGLPSAPPPDQNVQIGIEVNDGSIQEPAFPLQAKELCVLDDLWIAVQAYS